MLPNGRRAWLPRMLIDTPTNFQKGNAVQLKSTLPSDQRHSGTRARRPATAGAAHAASTIAGPCVTGTRTPARLHKAGRSALGGLTLIELLTVVALVGLLVRIALPGFEAQLQRARRSDALVTMLQLQGAQERWRSNGMRYGSLADIGAPSVSAAGHYTLRVLSADEDGYEVLATASGAQARDAGCRHMALRMVGANPVYASGPDATVANPPSTNAKCWSL